MVVRRAETAAECADRHRIRLPGYEATGWGAIFVPKARRNRSSTSFNATITKLSRCRSQESNSRSKVPRRQQHPSEWPSCCGRLRAPRGNGETHRLKVNWGACGACIAEITSLLSVQGEFPMLTCSTARRCSTAATSCSRKWRKVRAKESRSRGGEQRTETISDQSARAGAALRSTTANIWPRTPPSCLSRQAVRLWPTDRWRRRRCSPDRLLSASVHPGMPNRRPERYTPEPLRTRVSRNKASDVQRYLKQVDGMLAGRECLDKYSVLDRTASSSIRGRPREVPMAELKNYTLQGFACSSVRRCNASPRTRSSKT